MDAHGYAKQQCIRMLLAFQNGFGSAQAAQIELGPITISGVEYSQVLRENVPSKTARCTVVCYATVGPDCSNWGGNAHGGYLAWLVDVGSTLPSYALAGNGRWSTSGVSTNISIHYIAAAPKGTRLSVESSVIMKSLTTMVLKIEVRDRDTNSLVAIATHTKSDIPAGRLNMFDLKL